MNKVTLCESAANHPGSAFFFGLMLTSIGIFLLVLGLSSMIAALWCAKDWGA